MTEEKRNIEGLCFHVFVDRKFISVEGNLQDRYRYLRLTKGFTARNIKYMDCFIEKSSVRISCSDPRFNYPLLSSSESDLYSLEKYFEKIDKHLN